MPLAKGLAYSAIGAVAGAGAWFAIIHFTGWSLWILAPLVGGAAGFGMMRATQMRGGAVPGLVAVCTTLVAIIAVRYIAVTRAIDEHLAVSESDALAALETEAAEQMDAQGEEVYDEDGNYTAAVRNQARKAWNAMSKDEQSQYMASMRAEYDEAAGVLTPLALFFDFGIFGTICTLLAAGTAYKTGSATLESALAERDPALTTEQAASVAARLRAEDAGSHWSLPVRPEDRLHPALRRAPGTDPPRPASDPRSPHHGQPGANSKDRRTVA